jgi:hypothetical protein
VDRFGQEKEVVRATLMYGANNPVDGAVLDVIIRKAAKIREELGVSVPLPDEGHALTEALLKAVLLRRGGAHPSNKKQLQLFDERWEEAAERTKRNRATVFAQRRLKPEDVLPEFHKTLAAVGGADDVRRFTDRALARLGSGLEPLRRGYKAPLGTLPDDVRERLELEGLVGSPLIDFAYPAAPKCRPVLRTHPLVSVLAETLLERTLAQNTDDAQFDPGALGRVGCWVSAGVKNRTTVLLLRLRHQLMAAIAGKSRTILVEEATALAWVGASGPVLEGNAALSLLVPPPVADPPPHVRARAVTHALETIDGRVADLDTFAAGRADALLADHRRVREAADARGSYSVKALLPPDIIGVFVLLPPVS